MKVQQIMERVGITETGRAIAYIKDGLEEMNLISNENIVQGNIANVTGTGISFTKADTTGGEDSSIIPSGEFDAQGGSDNAIIPSDLTDDGWGYWDHASAGDQLHDLDSIGYQIEREGGGGSESSQGIRRATTVIPGMKYVMETHIFCGETPASTGAMHVFVANTDSATYSGVDIDLYDYDTGVQVVSSPRNGVNNSSTSFSSGTFKVTFTPTQATVTFYIGMWGLTTEKGYCEYLRVYPYYSYISDSNNSFGNFSSDMSLLVNGSSSNETDKEYAAGNIPIDSVHTSVTPHVILTTDRTEMTTEVAGDSITLRGQTNNYMDVIKDKRKYFLPDDMVKLIDVRVKNHLNTKDQWRSIPRMIGRPLNTDVDEV